MPIRLSQYFENTSNELSKEEILVDVPFSKSGADRFVFSNCNFIFEANGALKLQGCIINNCKFYHINSLQVFMPNAGNIEIISCKMYKENYIGGEFRSIKIIESVVNNFIDFSNTTDYSLTKTDINGFVIQGQCDTLITNEVHFLSTKEMNSIWDKRIIKNAHCVKTNFDNVRLNPFYLATKCADKSYLDISRATLIDDWSRLRKKYAGLSLFIVFLLTFLFFLPIATHSFFLLTLSTIEKPLHIIEKIPLWKALLFGGKQGLNAVIYSLLTAILLFYNIGRLYMTISISRLREEEIFLKDSNFNMVSIHPEKYKTQLWLDKILSLMFWISIGYSLLKLWDTLKIAVPAFHYNY